MSLFDSSLFESRSVQECPGASLSVQFNSVVRIQDPTRLGVADLSVKSFSQLGPLFHEFLFPGLGSSEDRQTG